LAGLETEHNTEGIMNIQTLSEQLAAVKIPKGVLAVDFDGLSGRKPTVHVEREKLLGSVDREHLDRVGHDAVYDMLKTEINGVVFFCLEKRENHCPCCGGEK
jgi:hypothetical protein